MGTGNFYALCGQYYIIESNRFDYDFESEVKFLQEQIMSKIKTNRVLQKYKHPFFSIAYIEKWDNNRNYPGRGIVECPFVINYRNITIDIVVVVFLRSGYYEHYNLDYEIELSVFPDKVYTTKDIESHKGFYDFIEDILWTFSNMGIRANKSKTIDIVGGHIGKITKTLDSILSSMCDCVAEEFARFSKGEVMYQERKSV